MAEESGGEKTLPASPQKKQKARQDGNVAKSQDLTSSVALLVALLAFFVFGPTIRDVLIQSMQHFLGSASDLTVADFSIQALAVQAFSQVGRCVVPFMIVMVVTGVALNLAQIGFLITGKPLQPKLDRLNPISGFKRYTSLRTLMELFKNLAKLGMVGLIVWLTMRSRVKEFVILMEAPPEVLLYKVTGLIVTVWWRIAVFMLVLGLIDFAFQRWQHEQELKMTQQEAKQEMKEMEGDPHVKRRVRQLQRQLAMQRMMADVPEADVIITNPTHYAVALRYNMSEMAAPTVVAKGMRLVAQRIRELGVEHDVPIVQKPELARALYRTLEVGQPVPEDLFTAVAEVLSFVYSIDRRHEKQQERRPFMKQQVA